MKFLILLSVLFSFSSQEAVIAKQKVYQLKHFSKLDLPIGKGTKIKITDYDPRIGGVFEGISVKEPGEGVFYTRIEYLIQSTPELKKYLKKPKSLKGKVFSIKEKLITVLGPSPDSVVE